MAPSVAPLHVASALGVTAMIIVTGALAASTTTTAVTAHRHAADLLMSMAHLEDVTMTLIDGIIHRLTRMPTVVPTIVPHETSPHEKAAMLHVKVARILARSIGEGATGKHLSPPLNAPPYVV